MRGPKPYYLKAEFMAICAPTDIPSTDVVLSVQLSSTKDWVLADMNPTICDKDETRKHYYFERKNGAPPIEKAHDHSSYHFREVMQSQKCGCFYCCKTFNVSTVEEWIDEGQTAICPHCSIDSVIPELSFLPLTEENLKSMSEFWFSNENSSTYKSPPWTEDQVKSLEEYQRCSLFIEYACSKGHLLVPTKKGWLCKECSEDNKLVSRLAGMTALDWTWKRKLAMLRALGEPHVDI